MATFENTLREAADKLRRVEQIAQIALQCSGTVVPASCYQHWKDIAAHQSLLLESTPLLSIRNCAFEKLLEITKPNVHALEGELTETSRKYLDPIHFNGQIVPFATARYLTLSSYVSAVWSLYDRLSIFCGQLIGPVGLAHNPLAKRMPKLVHAFIRPEKEQDKEKDKEKDPPGNRPDGFSLGALLPCQWEWPATICYKIRNLVLHDGIGMGGSGFFASDEYSKGFLLTPDAQDLLLSAYLPAKTKNTADYSSRSAGTPGFPWFNNDLRDILERYHGEIDEMLERLIRWGVDSFVKQVTVFAEPDKQLLPF